MGAAHESKIYCHYYNNNKECPFDDQCIFIHDDAEDCKYGKACERKLCMYKHDDGDEDGVEDEESDDEDDDDDEDEEINDNEDKVDELKPSLEKVRAALVKVDLLLKKVAPSLKCDQCDFIAKNENGLTMHKKSKHNNKS